MFQAILDGDTTSNSSVKRVRRSVDDTVKFAGICADLKEKSEVSKSKNLRIYGKIDIEIFQILKDTPMLACITGGYNIKERLRCITELKGLDAAGYVLEGFHTNGESATNLSWDDMEPVLTETLVCYHLSLCALAQIRAIQAEWNVTLNLYFYYRAHFQLISPVCSTDPSHP